jgi:hypothetical protein
LRCCVVVGVSGEHLAIEQAAAEILVCLLVGDGSLLLHLAIGRRLVLALRHLVCLQAGTAVRWKIKVGAMASWSYERDGENLKVGIGDRHTTIAPPTISPSRCSLPASQT